MYNIFQKSTTYPVVLVALNQRWFPVIPNGHGQGALEASKILAKIVASTTTTKDQNLSKAAGLEMEELAYTLGVATS